MKSLILFLLFTFPIAPTEHYYIYLNNLSGKNKFEVYISEGKDVIFYGIVYPKKQVLVEMQKGKLYGIKVTQITRNLEPTTQLPVPKNPAKSEFKDGIDYYWCVGRDLIYSFGVKTDIP
jgi:hypothetical protein